MEFMTTLSFIIFFTTSTIHPELSITVATSAALGIKDEKIIYCGTKKFHRPGVNPIISRKN